MEIRGAILLASNILENAEKNQAHSSFPLFMNLDFINSMYMSVRLFVTLKKITGEKKQRAAALYSRRISWMFNRNNLAAGRKLATSVSVTMIAVLAR